MIIGEGLVFLAILIFGIIYIKNNIKKELEFSKNQNNFLLSVTHELKTPIAGMKLFLQTLKKHNIEKEKKDEIIHKALQQNQQLEILIDNILNAASLESKKFIPRKELINVSILLNNISERYIKQYSNIIFKIEIQNNIYTLIDPFIFETIINNLIENAIKYGNKDNVINIILEKKYNNLIIKVKDRGNGIPNHQIKNIFKKFYRIENEDTRTQKGSGLGLFIVNEFIKLHGGRIMYYNNSPKGAVFEISFKI
jgi:K+-sensing histidine kinase KdpD